jgi:hypothetical protein
MGVLADAAAGSQRNDLGNGEIALVEDVEHFAAHHTGGADDGDLIGHVLPSFSHPAGRHPADLGKTQGYVAVRQVGTRRTGGN